MSGMIKTVSFVVLCALTIVAPSAWAYWIPDGVAICTAPGNQKYAAIVSDGAGGAIIAWQDYRSGNYDIYAQRIDVLGSVRWTANGVALCTAAGNQEDPQIISDGAGGAIIAWRDSRSGNFDIYAQRVNASGAVQWTANGAALCTATGTQSYPQITSDDASGAIVTWQDYRSGNFDIYAQKVNSSGTVQWTANGVALCTEASFQAYPQITFDGAGGAIVTWEDLRSEDGIYAQRVNSSGTVQWTANGVALCTSTGMDMSPVIISDGAGGAITAWASTAAEEPGIHAQRLNSSGSVLWTTNGVDLCTALGGESNPTIISDGAGGACIAWSDSRSGAIDIYAQRVDASGIIRWTADGVPICTAAGDEALPRIVGDDAGDVIIVWKDVRSGDGSIYAQKVNSSGAVQWTANGVPLCTAAVSQEHLEITSDGASGAIVTWDDWRIGNNNIYAQSLDARGQAGMLAPGINSVRDVPGDEGGEVYVSWFGARADVLMDGQMSYYSIWRAIASTEFALALENGASPVDDLSKLNPASGKPAIRIEQAAGRIFFWELVQTVDALYMPAYGKPVATLFDSTVISDEYHYFQVVAHTTTPTVFWKSEPDSGYSIDNLSPCPPQALAGEQSLSPVGLMLTWDTNSEIDLAGYAVYRGTTPDFVPSSGCRIAAPADTLWFDADWHWSGGYYYKVSAIDIHGNESGFALLAPDDVTGNDTPRAPEASYLSQNYPNPFNPATRIAFGLAAPSRVSLRIYDAAGRLVRVLVDDHRSAGRYEELWDGRDSSGRSVASGIYFYRLAAGSFEETKKMALLR